ncbi:MAG: hypothetical protein ABIJ96_02350 [Elusimicrobiota bacterium]
MKYPLLALMALLASGPALAQDRLTEMERKLEVLGAEIERLKLDGTPSSPGGSAGANTTLGGYGEMVYQNYRQRRQDGAVAGQRDTIDMYRTVAYIGHKFNDWITLHSEIEFEHGTDSTRGEVSVEQAALDLAFKKWFGLRAGMMLMPVGIINETHEPNTYHGALRPSVESKIIPSTWRENGIGIFGTAGPLSYRSYIVAGLQAANASSVSGFNHSSGVRSGRSKGSKSFADDLAWVGRIDVSPLAGLSAGGSLYIGEADQSQLSLPSVPVTIWELHTDAKWRGAELRGLFAKVKIGSVDELNVVQGVAAGSNSSIGSEMFGVYLHAAYNIFTLWPGSGEQYLAPFFRFERYDTQHKVPDAWNKNPANNRIEYTVGLTYRPHPRVALKLDHQFMRNLARTGIEQTNFGVGYAF